ncbi:MAG: hypothetical protein HZB42_11245 [Sphingobacteriales bacterium]|nr:hypothetical protein [Sphingobacteriales bacterium]
MKLFLTAIAALLLLGCENKSGADNKKYESLLGLSLNYDKKEITITVVSSGCTTKADFSFTIDANTIKIERKKRDECKMTPEAINLVYSFQESGIDADKNYTVVNSFIGNPNLANIH